jgi:hypothetical protein
MEKISVAKIIFGSDLDYMYDNESRPGLCPVCHNTIKKIPDLMYRVTKRKPDLMHTYDGFCIVSEKFKGFCIEREYPNLTFIALVKSKGFYYFEPHDIYGLDYARRKVQFITKRDCCGNYDEVIGATPGYKSKDFDIGTNDFVCRAEYFFGSHGRKGPLIIIGLETVKAMKEYGLRGIYFDDIYL